MIPRKYSHLLFSLLLSGKMSFIVSGIATLRTIGLSPVFPGEWMQSWVASWMVAFPAVLLIAPVTSRLVRLLSQPE